MDSCCIYRPVGPILARVSTYPGEPDLLADWELHPGLDTRRYASWLAWAWQVPQMQAAVWLANPELADKVTALLASDPATLPSQGRVVRRLAIAVACYLLRWQHRPTPFGLFAGITTASSGPATSARFGLEHRVPARPDGAWLAALVTELEQHPALRKRLPLVANNEAVTRGGWLVVPGRPAGGAGPGPLVEVSVRCSGPVRLAMAAAVTPVMFAELAQQVRAAFPAAGADKATGLIAGLVGSGFLLSAFRPPTTVVDTLGYLRDQLRAAGGADMPCIAAALADLDDIAGEFGRHDTAASPAGAHAVRVRIAAKMRALAASTGPVIAADTAVDGHITLPDAVLQEAARAADVLVRTTAQPFGTAAWTDYHVSFRELYGPGALVPVQDLVADSGLGFPAGFLGAACGRAARPVMDRDAALLALLQEIANDRIPELELTEQAIAALSVAEPGQMVVPDRVELAFEVHARSPADIDHGRFELWVTGVPRSSSSMAGRFVALLPDHSRKLLVESYLACADATAGDASDGTLAAQLSFAPRRVHNDNVIRVPPLLPALVSLGEYPDPDAASARISIADLAVTADATQMYLVHAGTSQVITPRALHAMEASVHIPPLARFLAEIASARHAVYGPFDFGVARTLPHLPRVRCGRTILAPARWTMKVADLPGSAKPAAAWEEAFGAWRLRWRVPPHLTLVEGDLRLPVDLDCPAHRAIVRVRLNRAGSLEFREAPSPADRAWVGRACEFLLPLTAVPTSGIRVPHVGQAARPASWTPPGCGEVMHALLLGHPARYPDILTTHVPGLLGALGSDVLRWWYARYRDTTRPDSREHLSLLLRPPSAERYGAVAGRLAGFAAGLHCQGLLADLTLRAYQPKTGRYGDLDAYEQVASADSVSALAQITVAAQTGIPLEALTAASMTRIAAALAPDAQTGYRWLTDRFPRNGPSTDRPLRDTALDLALAGIGDLLKRYPGSAALAESWQVRHRVLTAYRDALERSREPVTVLRSLLHEQHVRTMGIGPATEDLTNHLARAAALRGLAITPAVP